MRKAQPSITELTKNKTTTKILENLIALIDTNQEGDEGDDGRLRDEPEYLAAVEHLQTLRNIQPIVITVEGGVIQSIDNIPPGQVVQVWDFDVQDERENVKENEQGEKFYLSEYVGRNG